MKERPILFSAPMVRAILDGRKTQTRRIMKNQPCGIPREAIQIAQVGEQFQWQAPSGFSSIFYCPYGQPGDRLWVREAWARDDEDGALLFRADDSEATRNWEHERIVSGLARYRWRPSIHMPRWASRITLEITDVRVERLNEISLEDVIAEGISELVVCLDGTDSYKELWESINGPGSWDANPWVWIVEFERIKA